MLSTSKKLRPPTLTDDAILRIVEILDGWTGSLTWDFFIESIKSKTGHIYTRQALDRHERISNAFKLTKERVRQSPEQAKRLSPTQKEKRLADYDRLEAEVARLNSENEGLLQQFVVWFYNATQHGLSIEQLNAPLPRKHTRESDDITS